MVRIFDHSAEFRWSAGNGPTPAPEYLPTGAFLGMRRSARAKKLPTGGVFGMRRFARTKKLPTGGFSGRT